MSTPPVVLRRSTRNTAKRESPAVNAVEEVKPLAKKRTATAASMKPAANKKVLVPENITTTTAVADETKEAVSGLNEGDILPDGLPEVHTHTGDTTTLAALVEASEKGIVIFAYPKASTPGCTVQACAFRDSTVTFKNAGYAIYGLSGDSPSANEKFKAKQSLADITLLCDSQYELHARLQIKKVPKGTVRSVVVINKTDEGAVIIKKSPASPTLSVKIAQEAIGISDVEVLADMED